jgi:hypothetical protein
MFLQPEFERHHQYVSSGYVAAPCKVSKIDQIFPLMV